MLPCDGTAHYFGPVMAPDAARAFYDALLAKTAWRHDEVVIFGRRIVTAREMAWHGDAGLDYTYSGTTREALPWNGELLDLKRLVETESGETFNSCLLNLYHDGNEGMGWHSDDEKSLVREAAIASLSLGTERKFRFKHRRQPLTADVMLEHGSLLVMKGTTQANWLHCLPKSKRITEGRINLTFRKMAIA